MFKYHDVNNHITDLYFQTVLSLHLLSFVSLITNYLVTFFMLLFNYPALLTIHTYHSLIGAVFLYRQVCVKSVRVIPCDLIVH